jgi:hypothetical protein
VPSALGLYLAWKQRRYVKEIEREGGVEEYRVDSGEGHGYK